MPDQPRQPLPTPTRRYPFLLVDRVLEWEYGKYAVGYKCVTVSAVAASLPSMLLAGWSVPQQR